MKTTHRFVWLRLVLLCTTTDIACAQPGAQAGVEGFPHKPIRIVTGGTGGSSDFVSRLLAQYLAPSLGQQVIVDNRASGVIPGQIVSQSPPDGHTMLVVGYTFWVGPLMRKTPYDPVKDFSPISLVTSAPTVLVVNPALAARSVKELIALAKSKPGELNYSSGIGGSTSHLAAELFKAMARVDIVRVPYKLTSSQITDLIAGNVQLNFGIASSVMPHVKAGRLRALAVSTAQPSVLAPDLPTIAATGVPGYEAATMTAIFAPAKTPAILINRLNEEIVKIVNLPEVKEKFLHAGVETVGSSPQELALKIKAEISRLGKVIQDAGIRED